MHHTYKPRGICSSEIEFDVEDGVVKNIAFKGGCNGNLKAISAAVDGWEAGKIIETFSGITCGFKPTSCSDQLAKAIAEASNA